MGEFKLQQIFTNKLILYTHVVDSERSEEAIDFRKI